MCKACAKLVDESWTQLVKAPGLTHMPKSQSAGLSISTVCTHFITQLTHTCLHTVFQLFASVNTVLSPSSTGPTITTTLYINTYLQKGM